MVIREAEELRLGVFTFKDARMHNEMGGEQAAMPHAWNSRKEMAEAYQNLTRSYKDNGCPAEHNFNSVYGKELKLSFLYHF